MEGPSTIEQVLPRFKGKMAYGGQEPRAWMPHDEETGTPNGAKVVIVTNMAGSEGTSGVNQENVDIEFTQAEIRKLRLKAWRYLLITSNEFSEYYLPFVVATFPLVILGWQLVEKWT